MSISRARCLGKLTVIMPPFGATDFAPRFSESRVSPLSALRLITAGGQITPPASVRAAMDTQAEAERRKRADILNSEGERQAYINVAQGRQEAAVLEAKGKRDSTKLEAEGKKTAAILEAEGFKEATILEAEGRLRMNELDGKGAGEYLAGRAEGQAKSLNTVAESFNDNAGAQDAGALTVAESYVEAFGKLAKETNTVLLPSNAPDPSSMIASAMSIFNNVGGQHKK